MAGGSNPNPERPSRVPSHKHRKLRRGPNALPHLGNWPRETSSFEHLGSRGQNPCRPNRATFQPVTTTTPTQTPRQTGGFCRKNVLGPAARQTRDSLAHIPSHHRPDYTRHTQCRGRSCASTARISPTAQSRIDRAFQNADYATTQTPKFNRNRWRASC